MKKVLQHNCDKMELCGRPALIASARREDLTTGSRRDFLSLAGILGCGLLCSCRSVPLTQRRQLLLIPEKQELLLGAEAYQQMLAQAPLSQNTRLTELVRRVGYRIAAVADRSDYQWEFKLIADPTQNAFCLPGGKVAMYEGMLPVCEDEAGVATVMAHEVAHALARHGGERMSQNLVADRAKMVAEKVTGSYAPGKEEVLMLAYGVSTQYGVLLPFSRKHELEADRIGIMLMAEAGYDPQAAPRLWQRFAMRNESGAPTEFFSTHPSDTRRVQELNGVLTEAQQLYQTSRVKIGIGERI
jgi:predicted Zn-dependent protease